MDTLPKKLRLNFTFPDSLEINPLKYFPFHKISQIQIFSNKHLSSFLHDLAHIYLDTARQMGGFGIFVTA